MDYQSPGIKGVNGWSLHWRFLLPKWLGMLLVLWLLLQTWDLNLYNGIVVVPVVSVVLHTFFSAGLGLHSKCLFYNTMSTPWFQCGSVDAISTCDGISGGNGFFNEILNRAL